MGIVDSSIYNPNITLQAGNADCVVLCRIVKEDSIFDTDIGSRNVRHCLRIKPESHCFLEMRYHEFPL